MCRQPVCEDIREQASARANRPEIGGDREPMAASMHESRGWLHYTASENLLGGIIMAYAKAKGFASA